MKGYKLGDEVIFTVEGCKNSNLYSTLIGTSAVIVKLEDQYATVDSKKEGKITSYYERFRKFTKLDKVLK